MAVDVKHPVAQFLCAAAENHQFYLQHHIITSVLVPYPLPPTPCHWKSGGDVRAVLQLGESYFGVKNIQTCYLVGPPGSQIKYFKA